MLVAALSQYLGCPVVLSDQTQPEPEAPFVYYSILTDMQPTGEMGAYRFDGVQEHRRVNPTMTLSFTAVSWSRWQDENTYIQGEDEAMELCERMQGFFLHSGKDEIYVAGFVVVDLSDSGNRSFLEVDQMARQYGFDVQLRYCRVDSRTVGEIKTVVIKKE